jgi:hypothetical protein
MFVTQLRLGPLSALMCSSLYTVMYAKPERGVGGARKRLVSIPAVAALLSVLTGRVPDVAARLLEPRYWGSAGRLALER